MLTDIYARTILTATRQDGLCLRDLPMPDPLPLPKGRIGRIANWIMRHSMLKPRRIRCVDIQKL